MKADEGRARGKNADCGRKVRWCRHPDSAIRRCSALDQADIARARAFLRIFGRELDALAFAQQLEHGTAHRAAMEEVLDSALVADEPEALVDEEPLRSIPRVSRPVTGACEESRSCRDAGPAEFPAFVELANRGQSRQFTKGSQAESKL
jgi:hypothetical protein